MKNRSSEKIKLTSIDELLGVVNEEAAMEIEIRRIHSFADHPFKVMDDEKMDELVASIKENGVLVPVLLRPDEHGEYEMVSGHRRMHASMLAGFDTIPAIIREMTNDEAVIAMVDANIQREELLPSEKAFAYKMKMEAMKHQGERTDLTLGQNVPKFKRTTEAIAYGTGESYKQVQRFIRLTNLIPELLDMVDNRKIAFNPAVELSYLTQDEQTELLDAMDSEQATPSLSQAQRLRELDKSNKLTGDMIDGILSEVKKEADKVIINSAELEKYFGKEKTPREMKDQIIKLLDDWKGQQKEQAKPEKKSPEAEK